MEELMQRQIHDGEKTEKKLSKGEGKRVQISEWGFTSATLLTLDWGGGEGGPCPLAELDRGTDSAGTPATLTSYLNSDLNFFQNMFTCL